ncbi:hypothetical protein FB45DRAFT_1059759 [Roridomyces roridus]|uniref:Uncharacterized protein n=1 Tax=Roridomyces roridus TaxID=1738132 RepID=A0AAD7BPZ6_9AGAR|nr:hypothetical protein FB45DRAFT_1059759 [Roridomyces roridus]
MANPRHRYVIQLHLFLDQHAPTMSRTDEQILPADLPPPRAPFAGNVPSHRDSGLSQLSTQAQAGSEPSLPLPTSSSETTLTSNLSTVVHTGREGSPHPVAPLRAPPARSGSRFVESETMKTPSDLSSDGTESVIDSVDLTAVGAPDVLAPSAPSGVIPASSASTPGATTTVLDPVAVRERDAAAAAAHANDSEDQDRVSPKPNLLQRLKEKIQGGHHGDDADA